MWVLEPCSPDLERVCDSHGLILSSDVRPHSCQPSVSFGSGSRMGKKRIRVEVKTVHARCQKFGEVATSVSFVRDSKQRTICADSILLEDAGELIVLVRSTWGRKSGTSF